MKRLIRALSNQTPRKLHIDFYDRHAEHIDPNIPLCNHKSYILYLGETFRGTAEMSITETFVSSGIIKANSEFEIKFVKPNRIQVVVNMPDYLAAKRVTLSKQA
jgi:hypothetical protein